jgi:hypothetical protein
MMAEDKFSSSTKVRNLNPGNNCHETTTNQRPETHHLGERLVRTGVEASTEQENSQTPRTEPADNSRTSWNERIPSLTGEKIRNSGKFRQGESNG